MTVPNLITTIRIILAPVFIIYLINDQFLWALVVFVLCVASDGLDGLVARLFNQKSTLGTYLDPLADKILLVSAFITLSVRGYLPAWLTVMVIARDVMIMLGAVLSVLSKDYTGFPTLYYLFVYNLTALFTISSGLHYMHYWFKMMGEGGDNQGNIS